MARRSTATPSFETATGHARDYVAVALAYARDAVADRKGIKHCALVRLAAKRFLADLKRASRKSCEFRFSAWHGNDICDFVEKLPHVQGAWDSPTLVLEPAQIFILVNVFGFRRRSDGRRRFTRAYIEVARKNAKSTLTAGVALYCLTCEGELGPEIVIGATTGAQADKVFKPAKLMVDRTPALRDAFAVRSWARAITCSENGGTIQPINAKSSTQDGWNPFVGILDELHAHKDRGLFDVIRSAFGARKQPLMWMITTAGYNLHGVCYEQRELLVKILDGVVEADHYFGIVYTLDEGDDVFDERVWQKANPLLGSAVDLAEMRGYALEARSSPASLGEFKTKRLNMWLNAASAWLSVEQWQKAVIDGLDWQDFRGLRCTVGADLADKDDITAVVLAGQRPCGQLIVKPMFFLPAAALARETQSDTGQSTYGRWAGRVALGNVEALPDLFDAGARPLPDLPDPWRRDLLITPGDFVDHGRVREFIRWLKASLTVDHCVFDQWGSAIMASALNEEFGNDFATILHKSAANVTAPATDLEARIRAGAAHLGHDGNPVMTWMVSNVVVTRGVNGSIVPKKETPNSPNKIDGVDALINAMAPLVLAQEPRVESVFEQRARLKAGREAWEAAHGQ